ncbi:MAG: glycosyltransferase family 4 protein [Candidatus Hermodarchaeota archaeon]
MVIDEGIPYPLNTGKRTRTYNLLVNLAKSNEIFFICHKDRDSNHEGIERMTKQGITCSIVPKEVREKSGPIFYMALMFNLLSSKPYIVSSHSSRQIKACVRKALANKKFDLIHCEWTPYTDNIISLDKPKVLSAPSVEAQIWQRYFEHERNHAKKIYIGLQKEKIFNYEKRAVSLYNKIITVSEEDKKLFEDWYGAKNVTVVPNGVDTEYFRPIELEEQKNSLVFTGSMDWRPNQDAVNYFLDQIFPLIQQEIPDISFTIAGRKPPQWLVRKVERIQNVQLTGTVEDIRSYIAKSSIYVVPLRVGGGSRLKIIEALAMKKPVVSTTIGAEGLNVKDEENIILADQPEIFCQRVSELLNNQNLAYKLGDNGRQLVVQQYDWRIIADILGQVWQKALSSCKRS